MRTEIRVKVALVHAKQPLAALADISISYACDTIQIYRAAVFQRPGIPAWVSLPRLQVAKQGVTKSVPLIELSRDLKARIFDAILTEYKTLHEAL